MTRALVLNFGGVISKTMYHPHDHTEAALRLEPGTLTWRGPHAPETDSPFTMMQAGDMSKREYWALKIKEVGALVGEEWTSFKEFVAHAKGTQPEVIIRSEALNLLLT